MPAHPPEPVAIFDAASRALFTLGRAFNRMPRRDLTDPHSGPDPDLGAILLTQTIADAQDSGEPVTVGAVADRLALDPSTASRLVARGVARDLIRRSSSTTDGRAVSLSLTDSGQDLVTAAARFQRSIFDAATASWSPTDRATFAHLFVAFTSAVLAMNATAQELP